MPLNDIVLAMPLYQTLRISVCFSWKINEFLYIAQIDRIKLTCLAPFTHHCTSVPVVKVLPPEQIPTILHCLLLLLIFNFQTMSPYIAQEKLKLSILAL